MEAAYDLPLLKGGEPADLKNQKPTTDFQYLPKSIKPDRQRLKHLQKLLFTTQNRTTFGRQREKQQVMLQISGLLDWISLLLTAYMGRLSKKQKSKTFKLCFGYTDVILKPTVMEQSPEHAELWGHHLPACSCFSSSLAQILESLSRWCHGRHP